MVLHTSGRSLEFPVSGQRSKQKIPFSTEGTLKLPSCCLRLHGMCLSKQVILVPQRMQEAGVCAEKEGERGPL